MTAATTPRLGLMLPALSDGFTPDDFDTTFQILDGAPGITPVANVSALPTGLTQAQHGSTFLQMDNGAMWRWYRPTSSPGSWLRVNSVGVLGQANSTATLTTTTTDRNLAPTVVTTTVTNPGGRWLDFTAEAILFGSNGLGTATLWVNGTFVREWSSTIKAGPERITCVYKAPYAAGTVTAKITARCTALPPSSGGGGTVTCTGGTLTVSEI